MVHHDQMSLLQVTKLELYSTLITAFPCILVSSLLATWLAHTQNNHPTNHNANCIMIIIFLILIFIIIHLNVVFRTVITSKSK